MAGGLEGRRWEISSEAGDGNFLVSADGRDPR